MKNVRNENSEIKQEGNSWKKERENLKTEEGNSKKRGRKAWKKEAGNCEKKSDGKS